jgi:hypothetical protein
LKEKKDVMMVVERKLSESWLDELLWWKHRKGEKLSES